MVKKERRETTDERWIANCEKTIRFVNADPVLCKAFKGIVGFPDLFQEVRLRTPKFAPSHLPVFIYGPTGAGKESIARSLSKLGRPEIPFVAFNSASIRSR